MLFVSCRQEDKGAGEEKEKKEEEEQPCSLVADLAGLSLYGKCLHMSMLDKLSTEIIVRLMKQMLVQICNDVTIRSYIIDTSRRCHGTVKINKIN